MNETVIRVWDYVDLITEPRFFWRKQDSCPCLRRVTGFLISVTSSL